MLNQPCHRAQLKWLALSIFIIVLDQLSKWFVSGHLVYGQPVPVLGMLNWTLVHNEGAAFSFLSDAGGWQRWLFILLSLGISAFIVRWILAVPLSAHILVVGLAFILGGAIGNVIDRISLGYVVDFIHVHYQNHHFPAFNLADSAITVGAVLLMIDLFFLEKKRIIARDNH